MTSTTRTLKVALVGQESADNLRLANILRKIYGPENTFRYLELPHLTDFVDRHSDDPIVVCFDLFSFDLTEATNAIGHIRSSYPAVVFNLYVDGEEYEIRHRKFPGEWSNRLDHYYRTYKQPEDVEFEPVVRTALRRVEHEAYYNLDHEPITITPSISKGIRAPDRTAAEAAQSRETIFVSYSRGDWEGFVSDLVKRLTDKGFRIWIDQDLIVGGDEWMDTIGEALDICKVLVLVMSPEALESRYVKMEYRYFVNHDKRIVPILYREVDRIPFELCTTQYVDFKGSAKDAAYSSVLKSLGPITTTA
jgi:hypothetical protein